MNFSYKQIPLFRLMVPFIVGVLFAIHCIYLLRNNALVIVVLILSVLASVLAVVSRNYSYKKRWVFGVSLSVLMSTIGVLLVFVRTGKLKEQHVSHLPEDKYVFVGQVIEPPQEKQSAYKTVLQMKCVQRYGDCDDRHGEILAYLSKDSVSATLQYGDVILGSAYIQPIEGPKNPGEFDYRQYMAYQQVGQQVYLKSGGWKVLEREKGNSIQTFTYRMRDKALKTLKESGLEGDRFGVASALLLGYRDALEGEIIKAYAGAGAMHVLAVSGLHVGVIYLILSFLLKALGWSRRGAIIRTVIVIVILGFYGIITGMSPSVSRAIIMFACLASAQSFRFQTNVYNTLVFSAFILLLINPYNIMQVGFQLSYLAVAGISYVFPKLNELWEAPNKPVRWLWQITCLAVAAQLVTLPLVLFYFHQFPVYSLLSGPVVILGATGVIWLGLGLLAFSWLPALAGALGWVLDRTIYAMNAAVSFIEQLPLSLIKGIDISIVECCLLYVGILVLLIWLASKKVRWLVGLLGVVVILSTLQISEAIKQSRQKLFVVYCLPEGNVIAFITGKQAQVIGGEGVLESQKNMEYQIEPHWRQLGVNSVQMLDSVVGNIQFSGVNIAIIEGDSERVVEGDKSRKIDYFIISNNPKMNIKLLASKIADGELIFDASNSYQNVNRWKRQCKQLGIMYYDVKEQGAFVLEL